MSPAFASDLGELHTMPQDSYAIPALGTGTQPYIYSSRSTGESWIYNKLTRSFEEYAPEAPTFPNDYLYSDSAALITPLGAIVFVVNMRTSDYSRNHIYKSVFANGVWSSWQLILDCTDIYPKLYIRSYGYSNGHDVLLYTRVTGDNSNSLLTLGTNASGSWQELSIMTNSIFDHLGGDTLRFPDQVSIEDADIDYWSMNYSRTNVLDIQNGKMAMLGYVESWIPEFVVNDRHYDHLARFFTQVIDVNALTSTKRTLLGQPVPSLDSEDERESIGSVTYDDEYFHWNASKTDLVVSALRFIQGDCPDVPEGRDADAFTKGHCSESQEIVQFNGINTNVLANLTYMFGENGLVRFSEVQTASGWKATISATTRNMIVDPNGDFIQVVTSLGKFGYNYMSTGANGLYVSSPLQLEAGLANGDWSGTWLQSYKGIPAMIIVNCAADLIEEAYCTKRIKYISEGTSKTDVTSLIEASSQNGFVFEWPVSIGSDWIVEREGYDYLTDPQTNLHGVFSGGYKPIITQRAQTAPVTASSLKKGKTLSLSLKTKQTHAISWTVATKSKKICSITVTRKSGVITKLTLKGLKVGTCTLTAKASAGFFYKALNKTIAIKVK